MRVGQQLLALGLVAIFRTPDLRPGEEKALVAGQAINDWGLFIRADRAVAVCVEADLVGAIGQREAAKVADILAQRQLAIHAGLALFERAILVVLLLQCRAECVESGAILFGPPVLQDAVTVIFRPLVIKTMADLMTDHAANRAII